MIRYRVTSRQLESLIDAAAPATSRRNSWRERALEHTNKMKTAGKLLKKGAPSWSEVKSVYVELQKKKCAYCEKPLEAGELKTHRNVGAIEQDVEHYRPKSSVTPWTPDADRVRFPTSDGVTNGYYLLAYNIWNYCVSCKTCNTTYKSDLFPIEGTAGNGNETDIRQLNRTEKPLLPYPLGTLDGEDPENVITFLGYNPLPNTKRGRRHRRAITTIHFFDLDIRENLVRQRCDVIKSLYSALIDAGSKDPETRARGERHVKIHTSEKAPHTSCARAYRRLFLDDVDIAHKHYEYAMEFLEEGIYRTSPPIS